MGLLHCPSISLNQGCCSFKVRHCWRVQSTFMGSVVSASLECRFYLLLSYHKAPYLCGSTIIARRPYRLDNSNSASLPKLLIILMRQDAGTSLFYLSG